MAGILVEKSREIQFTVQAIAEQTRRKRERRRVVSANGGRCFKTAPRKINDSLHSRQSQAIVESNDFSKGQAIL